jgi:peptidylprolyl isomerase
MFGPKASLDHNYTVFGRVVSGMDAVDKIAPGEPPANPTKIVHASLGDGSAPAARVQPSAPTTTPAPADGSTPGS